MINPFTPSFGRVPPVLAGRDFMVHNVLQALDQSLAVPDLCTFFAGTRGMGKTAMVLHIAEQAVDLGWVTASTVACDGMLEDLFEQALQNALGFSSRPGPARVKGLGLTRFLGADWEYRNPSSGSWRTRMGKLLDVLGGQDMGLLLVVDDAQSGIREMDEFAVAVRSFVGEHRKFAVVMAGNPGNAVALIERSRSPLARYAVLRELETIPDDDVVFGLRQTMQATGREISDGALRDAAEIVGGYPYMMQLVGYRLWESVADGGRITRKVAAGAVQRAQLDLKNNMLDVVYRELSPKDRQFLKAMLQDEGPSRTADIAARMRRDATYARTYKERLLARGLIAESERGYVQFGIPFLRDYLEMR